MIIARIFLVLVASFLAEGNAEESKGIFDHFDNINIEKILVVKTEQNAPNSTTHTITDPERIKLIIEELKKIDAVGGPFKTRPQPKIRHDVYFLGIDGRYGSVMIEEEDILYAPETGASYPNKNYESLINLLVKNK